LGRDPAQEKGGLNLFEFCRNDPTDRYDLFGLYPVFFDNPPKERCGCASMPDRHSDSITPEQARHGWALQSRGLRHWVEIEYEVQEPANWFMMNIVNGLLGGNYQSYRKCKACIYYEYQQWHCPDSNATIERRASVQVDGPCVPYA
jgi:hypothetical protein